MENELTVTSAFYILSSKMVFYPITLSVLLQFFIITFLSWSYGGCISGRNGLTKDDFDGVYQQLLPR